MRDIAFNILVELITKSIFGKTENQLFGDVIRINFHVFILVLFAPNRYKRENMNVMISKLVFAAQKTKSKTQQQKNENKKMKVSTLRFPYQRI